MSLAIAIAFLVALLLLYWGMPVALALLVPSILYVLYFDIPILLVAQNMSRTLYSFTLLTVPLFIFVGSLMNNSGQTDRMFEFADALVGHYKGGLAYVNILASLIFSGISGSALADIGGVGKILMETMRENGYGSAYSAAITGASSTVGPIFPPSIPLIIYGILAEVSVLDLLVAGIVPGLLCVVALTAITVLLAELKEMPTSRQTSRRETFGALYRGLPALLVPVVLVGGMLGGFFGPAEVAAVAAAYVVAVETLVYRNVEVGYIWAAAQETIRTTVIVFFILMAASLFGWIVAFENVPSIVSGVVLSFTSNVILVLLLMNVMLLLLGLFLEPLSALVMTIPVFVPPLTQLGVDPVHLGVVMVLNLMIGLLTPPIGLSLYVASDISGAPVESIVGELKPYYVALLIVLLSVTLYPRLSLFVLDLT
jgi:tripartite ATP-independent transporter DctM subunit